MHSSELSTLSKRPRHFLPEEFLIDDWNTIQPFYEDLQNRVISDHAGLKQWLADKSELETVLQEEIGWRYIKMSCDINSKAARDSFNFFVTEVEPKIAPYDDALNKKLLSHSGLQSSEDKDYAIYLRDIQKRVEIYRENNIPLITELQQEEQNYASIVGEMTITENGEEITLARAANLLKDTDRTKREEVYKKITERRLTDRLKLDELYSKLITLRNQVALNAGFENYRDYMFAALGRFDYTVKDCYDFHDAIEKEIVPLAEEIQIARKEALSVDKLKPWDLEVDPSGQPALKPFVQESELMDKTIQCFYKINTFLGECMDRMKAMKHIDLESRKGKAPGGFNYPLYETGVPFVFMNGTNSLRDIITMVHEGGHAVHSILNRDLDFIGFKNVPSEVAELASMSMELMSMEHWDVFFSNPEDLKRAKKQQLEKVIETLPWIAIIDKFQHWVYTHPAHTPEERTGEWTRILKQFSGNTVNYEGQEDAFASAWQKQLHLYQVPFYYIEYGMAQLGAIAVWRNYKTNPEKALQKYIDALKLGYTRSIGEIYETAGIKFDFSQEYVKELVEFVKKELSSI